MKHVFFSKLKKHLPHLKKRFMDALDLFLLYQLILFILNPTHLMAFLLVLFVLIYFLKDYKSL